MRGEEREVRDEERGGVRGSVEKEGEGRGEE